MNSELKINPRPDNFLDNESFNSFGGSRSSAKFVEEITAFIESLNKKLMTLLRNFSRGFVSATAFIMV